MTREKQRSRFPQIGDGSGLGPQDLFYREELALALRNRGMPLEGLRYPITPVGMHYLLIHFDIPYVEEKEYRLEIAVEVSTDGGKSWSQAELGEPVGRFAWRGWRCMWQARSGRYTLCVRARDS